MQQTHMQHELGVSMDELHQRQQEALVTARVHLCGFFFEFKAGCHLFFKGLTLLIIDLQQSLYT